MRTQRFLVAVTIVALLALVRQVAATVPASASCSAGRRVPPSGKAAAVPDAPHAPASAESARAPAIGSASFRTTTISIPTYPYADYLTFVHDPSYNMTYSVLNWGSYSASGPTPAPQTYTLLILENDYLQATVLPELGGRVYQMVYKATGNNELYQNPVIKPTHWGPPEQGWWLAAGGIEWCLPVDEHGYEWAEPWSWNAITSTVGVTVTLRDSTAADRLRAVVDVFLPAARGGLAITPRLENPTTDSIEYKYWTNAMLAPGPWNHPTAGLEFAFNAPSMSVHSTGDWAFPCAWQDPGGPTCLFSWPVHAGRDYSHLGNWRQWLGFFEYPQAAADFVGVYSHDAGEGVARVFPSAVARGAKGFAFGWSDPIDWHNWTDDGSGYVEVHGGVAPTFWDTAVLSAGQTLSWTEFWYPVGSIGTLSAATEEAALGVWGDGGTLYVGVHSTTARAEGKSTLYVWDRATCAELGRWDLPAVDPADPFQASVAADGRSPDELTVVYADDEQNLLTAVNFADCLAPQARVEPLPPWLGTASFTVRWSGEDWTGIAAYDVQFRDGYGGAWTDWVTDTTAISATFTGAHGHSYFFRARARDLEGNESVFADEEWGQAFATVLTSPAPVLVTSRKSAEPRLFRPDQVVSYTVTISNTGSLTANAVLTDTVPEEMVVLTGTLAASSGTAPTCEGGQIRWNGTVSAGTEVRISYTLSPTVAAPAGVPLSNTAEIAGSVLGPLIRHAAVVQAHVARLPLVARNWGP